MLPRIAAALSQFIAPVASASKQPKPESQRHRVEEFPQRKESKREQKEEPRREREAEKKSAALGAQIIPLHTGFMGNNPPPSNNPLFQLIRWIGLRAYLLTTKRRKSLNKKGSMIDTKA